MFGRRPLCSEIERVAPFDIKLLPSYHATSILSFFF